MSSRLFSTMTRNPLTSWTSAPPLMIAVSEGRAIHFSNLSIIATMKTGSARAVPITDALSFRLTLLQHSPKDFAGAGLRKLGNELEMRRDLVCHQTLAAVSLYFRGCDVLSGVKDDPRLCSFPSHLVRKTSHAHLRDRWVP